MTDHADWLHALLRTVDEFDDHIRTTLESAEDSDRGATRTARIRADECAAQIRRLTAGPPPSRNYRHMVNYLRTYGRVQSDNVRALARYCGAAAPPRHDGRHRHVHRILHARHRRPQPPAAAGAPAPAQPARPPTARPPTARPRDVIGMAEDAAPATPRIRIELGDCCHAATLPRDSVDLVLMDPPWMNTDLDMEHGIDAQSLRSLLITLKDVVKPTGWLFCFGGIHLQRHLFDIWTHKFEYIWVKPAPVMATHNTVRPSYQHEPIHAYCHPALKRPTDLYFNKDALRTTGHGNYSARKFAVNNKTPYREQQRVALAGRTLGVTDGTRGPTSLLHFPSKQYLNPAERTPHPTQKPVSLMSLLVKGYCPPDGLVCDPFLGSGTTALAARAAGRRFVGWELNPEWHALATRRCADPLFDSAAAAAAAAVPHPLEPPPPPPEKKGCDP